MTEMENMDWPTNAKKDTIEDGEYAILNNH